MLAEIAGIEVSAAQNGTERIRSNITDGKHVAIGSSFGSRLRRTIHIATTAPSVPHSPFTKSDSARSSSSLYKRWTNDSAKWRKLSKPEDLSPLVDLCHSLKGAAGNCGFAPLSLAAAEIEEAARQENIDSIGELLPELRRIRSRIETQDSSGNPIVSSESVRAIAPETSEDDSTAGPITSTLPVHKEKFREIVSRFVGGLDDRFDAIQSALDTGDEQSLVELGHSMKGASGNCGFAPISEAASRLEISARASDLDAISEIITDLRNIQSRIEVPDFLTVPPVLQ